MEKDPFLNFISDLSKKIKVEREHRQLIENINKSEYIDENKGSLENVILKIKEKINEKIGIPELKSKELEVTETVPISSSFVKRVSEEENNFEDFVSKLKNILEKPSDSKPVKTEAKTTLTTPSSGQTVTSNKQDEESKELATKDYVEVLDRLADGVSIENNQQITDVKKLIEEYAEKYLKKAIIMSEYAGGGGTNAVQYAKGGTMDGDLNVTGNYLSAGVNLLDIFTGGGSSDPAVNALVHSNSAQWNLGYSGYTNLIYNSAAYLSGFDMSAVISTSASWNSAYTNLINNSAAYLSGYDLSALAAASGDWNSSYTTVKNTSAYWADTRYDVTFGQNVTVNGNLTALGTSTFKNTVFTTTSALSVVNTGPGPALYVFQASGPYDVASFYDGDGVEVLHVGNANVGQGGKVGINTGDPSVELTVNGQISANNNITVLGGNSDQWNSNYTTTQNNSASWGAAFTNLVSNSSVYLGIENVKNLSDSEYVLDINQFTIYTKRVSAENVFTYNNFVSGRTLTIYLSASHEGVIGHYFPLKTYFGSNGTSNLVYTFSGYATKITIQNVGDYFLGSTFLIPINVTQYTKAGDYMLMENFGFIFQEDDYRIILD